MEQKLRISQQPMNQTMESKISPIFPANLLTVRFLVSWTSTFTTKFLGLTPSVVGNEEGSVVGDKGLLEGVLGVLINELLVVSDDRLGNGLSDGVDLRDVSTSSDSDADVDTGELVETDNEERLVNLYMMLETAGKEFGTADCSKA